MNAMEHGSGYRADQPGDRPRARRRRPRAGADHRPRRCAAGRASAEVPDLEAKLAGLQRPRGWGLFLIENMVDETRETSDERVATRSSSRVRLKGGDDGDE